MKPQMNGQSIVDMLKVEQEVLLQVLGLAKMSAIGSIGKEAPNFPAV